ncbi:MAG: hypothetical protein ACTSUE_10050 [Promethearchaeota archaeon]
MIVPAASHRRSVLVDTPSIDAAMPILTMVLMMVKLIGVSYKNPGIIHIASTFVKASGSC